MKIYEERNLDSFEYWCGAEDNATQLTIEELDELEAILADMYPDGIDATELNDLMRFDFEAVCEWLGLNYDSERGVVIREDEE